MLHSFAKALPLLVATALLLTWARATAPEQVTLSIGQARLGNVFGRSESVVLPVATTADRILWSVTDFYGLEVASGEVASDSGRAEIAMEPPALGYFEVELRARAQDSGIASARTTFVVAPAVDITATADSPFGVMTHFAQGWDVDIVPLIARAGIRHVRDEQYWAQVEQHGGRHSFPERFTHYMSELAEHGLEPLIVLSFANALYDDGLTPFSDHGRAAYARYGRAVLDRYGPQIGAVEIWNEYNGSFCDGPCRDDRPAYYTRMLKRAYEEIKRSRPDVTVAGGAAVKVALPYFEAVFEAGGLDFMDAVVVHPYGSTPEGIAKEVNELERLVERHGHARVPIWATEIGHGSTTAEGRREAARYLVRMFTALLSAGVERVYWYLLRDYREFEGMGLLHGPDSDLGRYVPAPAYAAYANLIHQLSAPRFVRREPSDTRIHLYHFESSARETRVAWTTGPSARLRLEADEIITVSDIMGRQTKLVPEGGAADVVIDGDPVYIVGNIRRIAAAGTDEILADSVEDYSGQQGKSGWYYGYYEAASSRGGDGLDPGAYTVDDFELLEQVVDRWSQKWGNRRHAWLTIGPRGAHPSRAADRAVWAVRRWVSNVSAPVRLSGRIAGHDKGDGVTGHVLIDGRSVFTAEVGGPEHPKSVGYELEVTLAEDSRIDFALSPGPQRDIDFDSAVFTARITRLGPDAAGSQ